LPGSSLRASEPFGFALVGGDALIAHGIVDRRTRDVDLFSPAEAAPAPVTSAIVDALREAGYQVKVRTHPDAAHGQFARLGSPGGSG
jgi:hypothetical protein